jgi:ABC-type Mn2+/Zn2+ transport system permease subunit
MFFIILGIILWIIVALWPASIARRKGYSFLLFFLISLLFWWITLFVTLFMKDKTRSSSTLASPPATNVKN